MVRIISKKHGVTSSQEPIFGGMWDALYYENGKVAAVIEIKTTKRAEDWSNGAPGYYALQAALYAYLLGIDDVLWLHPSLRKRIMSIRRSLFLRAITP